MSCSGHGHREVNMIGLNEYFASTYEHPLAPLLNRHPEIKTARVQVNREIPPMGIGPTELWLRFPRPDGTEASPVLLGYWEAQLNEWLISRGIRAVSDENEELRFALTLRDSLRWVLNRFGDGYFNSIVVEHLKKGPFAGSAKIAELLKHISVLPQKSSSKAFRQCASMIDYTIMGRAHELRDKLHYKLGEATSILTGAVAEYLNSRFSVSRRLRFDSN